MSQLQINAGTPENPDWKDIAEVKDISVVDVLRDIFIASGETVDEASFAAARAVCDQEVRIKRYELFIWGPVISGQPEPHWTADWKHVSSFHVEDDSDAKGICIGYSARTGASTLVTTGLKPYMGEQTGRVVWQVLTEREPAEITCWHCGTSRAALMYRQYEAGTEWDGIGCCEGETPDKIGLIFLRP